MDYLNQKIAFYSFASINGVGTRFEVLAFFRLIDAIVTQRYPEHDISLINDRFYRRYIAQQDAPASLDQMAFIEDIFEQTPSSAVDWNELCSRQKPTGFPINQNNCKLVFKYYFDTFRESHGTSNYFFENGYGYEPVGILRHRLPYFAIDDASSLDLYDELEGDPFWLRPDETTMPNPPSYKGGKIVPDGTPGSVKPDYLSPDTGQAYFVHKLEPDQ